MKELGELKHFLEQEVECSKECLFLGQQRYGTNLLKKVGMLDFKPLLMSMEKNTKLCAQEGKGLENGTTYRQLVEILIYLTLTIANISFVVGVVSRYMQIPRKPHLEVVRQILRYVKETISLELFLYKRRKV